MTTQNPELLLDSNRGIYIPQCFVTEFDLSKFDGIDADDAETCKNPDSEGYWDAWANILDNATYTENGDTFSLWQDGDLWLVNPNTLSDEDYENFYGEPRE